MQLKGVTTNMFGGLGLGYCSICGRELSNPLSLQRGIGMICWNKRNATNGDDMDNNEHQEHLDIPLEHGITFQRKLPTTEGRGDLLIGDRMSPLIGNAKIYTNIPWRIKHHSPSGFEWGYGGSGVADFALNILEAVLINEGYNGSRDTGLFEGASCYSLAWKLHQAFKWEFLAAAPIEGTIIPYTKIVDWIRIQENKK